MRIALSLSIALTAIPLSAEISFNKLKKFYPLPTTMESAANHLTNDRIALGRMLYYDPRLSQSGAIACNTCHPLDRYGVDGTPVSTGHNGQKGTRNAPTVYNAAGQNAQFWDGRAPDVEQQAKGPILNPIEMAMPSDRAVVERLRAIPGYVTAFAKAFPSEKEPLTYDNLGKAIGAFERKLVTPSRWDRYLTGHKDAITNEEKKGFEKFYDVGCGDCHQGAFIGGQNFKLLGIEKTYPGLKDEGRFAVTKKPSDKYVFKTPSLRNIEKTAPYLHDGSIATLEECVRLMGLHQLGKKLTNNEVTVIVAWLKTLTGDLPRELIKAPALPR